MNETTNNNAKLSDNSTNKMDDKIKNSLRKNFEKNLAIESNKIIQVENNNSNNIASSCDKPGNKNSKIPEENLRKKSDETDKVNDTKVIFKKEDIQMEEKNREIITDKLKDPGQSAQGNDNLEMEENSSRNSEKTESVKSKGGSLWEDIRKFYKFKEILSSGQFGTVRIATKRKDDIKKFYAIKSISKKNLTDQDLIKLMKEVEILSCLDHPNIIKFYETYQDQYYFHLVMELCTGKEVFDQILEEGYITEQRVAQIIYKVTSAICYCHSIGITHRDIKPENILFESSENDGEIKLIDFGLSRKYNKNEKMHTILGTPYYVAPEVLRGEYDQKCDVWSIGAICYIMLCGIPPFMGNNNNEIFQMILNGELKFDENKWKNISVEAVDFINQCLNKNPEKRFSAPMALKHNWFKDVKEEVHSSIKLCKDILNNLKNYSVKWKLKKLVMKLFLVNFLTTNEMKKLRQSFQAIDFNNEGVITNKQFEIATQNAGVKLTEEEIKLIFKNSDENGKINYSEFLIGSLNEKSFLDKDKLSLAFKYFDVDENNYIDCNDLKNVLLRSGKEIMNTEELENIIQEVSQNKGKINFTEFLNMFEWEETN
jgi:calcium-dependent protein kinase